MDNNDINKIFTIFKKNNPKPKSELKYNTPFQLLIAVILSAQATDSGVNKATEKLFKDAPTPKKMLDLRLSGLKKYIKSIGLYNTKAKNIIQTCKIIVEKHNSKIPEEREKLEALPGVGRKTANVMLNSAFGHPVIAVDTHIFRVANRIGLTHAKTREKTEKQLYEVIPKKYQHDAHHWLILHGRYICIARKPKCYTCSIVKYCEYEPKNLDEPKKKG